jgi:hypothetical protein
MNRKGPVIFVLLLLLALPAAAQDSSVSEGPGNSAAPVYGAFDGGRTAAAVPMNLDVPAARPHMAPELALQTYMQAAQRQLKDLGAYSDVTVIEADLPDSSQHGRYELRRSFAAPKSLVYAAVHFAGDGFIKTNVIARLLQSEVDHVQKGEGAHTAITADNYKFTFKGTESVDGHVVYIYHLKPRQKRPGLFKGRILLDALTGRLRRAEGVLVKSPSFFVKRVEFVQDYSDFAGFSLPVRVHSIAKTRILGRAVVDISHSGYEARSLAETQADANTTTVPAGSSLNNR